MKRILVIGIGSIIMKDDGIGARVVEANEKSLQEKCIAVLIGETDFQSCFDEINPSDILIVIDAMDSGKQPGDIEIMTLSDALQNRSKLRTQHEFSLLDLIELHYPDMQGYLIGIEVCEIGFGFDLSEQLNQNFEQICADVLNAVLKIKEESEYA